MFERNDRSIERREWPVAVVVLIIAVLGGSGAYLWYSMDRTAPSGLAAQQQDAAPTDGPVLQDESIALTLFLPVNGMLEQVSSGVRRQPELQLEARGAAAALLASEQAAMTPVLKDLELRALYLDGAGTAFVDLAARGRKDLRASVWEELLAVHAVVNTLMQNFPEVRQVRFLVDGREAQTLAGHLDLSRAYVKRNDLVRP